MKNKLLILSAVIGTWWLAAENGVRLLVVTSGSMEPAIPAGSLIAVKTKDNYSPGDIISFNYADGRATVTHRISRIEEIGVRTRYITKGDKNEEEDLTPVYFNKVKGKVIAVIPKFGEILLEANQSLRWAEEMLSRAFLNDQESLTDNSLAAGTMDLKISDSDEPAGDSLAMTWEGSNLLPGQGTVNSQLKIKNIGTVAANHIHITVANSITQGAGPGADAADPMDANLEIQALQYNEVNIKSYLSDKNVNGIIDLDDWEKMPIEDFSLSLTDLNNDHTLSLTVGLRPQTSATNQGDTVTMNFLVTGHQLNDPVLVGYSDNDGTVGRFSAARDWTAPTSSVTGLANYQTGIPFTVSYEASDGISGVKSATLYYRKGSSGAFTMFATDTFNGESSVSGSFSFNVSGLGDGRYEFAILAVDVDGNSEAAPSAADGFTILDTLAPATTLTTTAIVVDEAVTNGDFSSGLSTGWNYTGEVAKISGSETAAGVTVSPPSGSGSMARIGHVEEDAGDLIEGNSVWDNRLTQIIDKQDSFLSFWWRVLSFDAGENPAAIITINDRQILRVTGAEIDDGGYPNDTGWQRVFVDLSDFSDNKLELKFYSGNTDSFKTEQSWMYIDEVTTGRPAIKSTASLILTGTDENGVKEIHYSLDDGATWEIKTGDTITVPGTDLTAGVNLVKYFAVDNAGNTQAEPTTATTVIVDDQAPNQPEDFDTLAISEHEISVNWTAPADLGYFTKAAYYRMTVNGATVPNMPAPAAEGAAETFMISGLSSATEYQVELSACDPVDNCSQAATATATTLSEHDADFGDVVINELMWMGMDGNTGDEWLELRNMTDQDTDLSDWYLTKKDSSGNEVTMYTFPAGTTLPASGYLLISEYDLANSALAVDPDIVVGAGDTNSSDFALANNDLQIKLYDSIGLEIDAADDGTGAPAAGLTDLDGSSVYYSMERNATPGDGTQASNWHTTFADTNQFFNAGLTMVKGTPGADNQSEGRISEVKTAFAEEPELDLSSTVQNTRNTQNPGISENQLVSQSELPAFGFSDSPRISGSPSFPSIPEEIASASAETIK